MPLRSGLARGRGAATLRAMATQATVGIVGTIAPDFTLPEVRTGKPVSRDAARGPQGLLVLFICRHCPYVVHVESQLAALGRDFARDGIGVVAISANDASRYPDDAPEGLARQATQAGFEFPYLHDEAQSVARAYGAACTPDPFLYDSELKLYYRGQLDDARPGNQQPVTGRDLREAARAMLAHEPAPARPKPAIGCSIKWR